MAVVGSCNDGCGDTILELLQADPQSLDTQSLPAEQQHDSELAEMISYLKREELPSDPGRAHLIVL